MELTAQQKGMALLGQYARAIVPPGLDFVVIVYPREGKLEGRTAYCSSTTVENMENRAIDAAAVFITTAKAKLTPNNS